MKTSYLSKWTAGLLLSVALFTSCDDDHEDKVPIKTYILIHGAAHGAWTWKKVVPLLEAQGHRVEAIDLPGHGDDKTPPEGVKLDDYADKVVDVAKAQTGPVVLIGHSSGGVTIAQAAERLGAEKVEKLIFLDAFLPKNAESIFSLAAKFLPPKEGVLSFSDTFIFNGVGATFTLDLASVANFLYHDCSEDDVAFARANLGKQPVAPFATPVQVTDAIYGAIPKYFIICSDARNGNMSEMSKNVPLTKVVSIPTSHSPFFSQPEELVDLINSFNSSEIE